MCLGDVSGVINTRLEITVCFHLFSAALIVFFDQTQFRGRKAWYIMQKSQGRNTGGNHEGGLLPGRGVRAGARVGTMKEGCFLAPFLTQSRPSCPVWTRPSPINS